MASEVDSYLRTLPADRRAAISAVRDAINATLAPGYEECLQYGMISWVVPERVLPAREVYNKQPLALASLGSQKHHMALYLMCVHGDPRERAWFESAYKKSGKKLDMGKSCLRFASLDALALDVVAEAMGRVSVDRYVEHYRAVKGGAKPAKSAKTTKAAKPAKTTKAAKPAKPAKAAKPAKPSRPAKAAKAAKPAKPGRPAKAAKPARARTAKKR